MDSEKSQQAYKLADATFKNVEELVKDDLPSLVAAAKVFHKSLLNALEASESFYSQLSSLGSRTTSHPGAVHHLGETLVEAASTQKQTNQAFIGWIGSLATDFILPLELKINSESKRYANLRKSYKQECSKKEHDVEKIHDSLKDYRKKEKRGSLQLSLLSAKDRHNLDRYADESAQLDTIRTEGLRKALLEERKLYCCLVGQLCQAVHHQVGYYTQGHSNLSQHLVEWGVKCASPDVLPPESLVLLVDPTSPKALQPSTALGSAQQRKGIPPGRITTKEGETFTNQNNHNRETSQSSFGDPPPHHHHQLHHNSTAGPPEPGGKKESVVRARYDFKATAPSQISFKEGDAIEPITECKDGWQFGKVLKSGETGWFPVSYIQSEDMFLASPRRRKPSLDTTSMSSSNSHNIVEMDATTHPAIRREMRGRHGSGSSTHTNMEHVMSPQTVVPPSTSHNSYGTPSRPAGILPAPLTPPPSATPPDPPESQHRDNPPTVQSI
nr:BAI1-associated protein 2 [Halisarca dujardinii]